MPTPVNVESPAMPCWPSLLLSISTCLSGEHNFQSWGHRIHRYYTELCSSLVLTCIAMTCSLWWRLWYEETKKASRGAGKPFGFVKVSCSSVSLLSVIFFFRIVCVQIQIQFLIGSLAQAGMLYLLYSCILKCWEFGGWWASSSNSLDCYSCQQWANT